MFKGKQLYEVEIFTALYWQVTKYLTESDKVGMIDNRPVYTDPFNRYYFTVHDPRED